MILILVVQSTTININICCVIVVVLILSNQDVRGHTKVPEPWEDPKNLKTTRPFPPPTNYIPFGA